MVGDLERTDRGEEGGLEEGGSESSENEVSTSIVVLRVRFLRFRRVQWAIKERRYRRGD